jgi:hypothetical protein
MMKTPWGFVEGIAGAGIDAEWQKTGGSIRGLITAASLMAAWRQDAKRP